MALGRAIVRNPTVFLMDEPLSKLDAKLRVLMRNEITKLHCDLKSTTVYVTHDQVEAMTMADRIVVMKAGKIQQIGTPMQLYNEPANRFVAGFIGAPTMNLIDATIVDDYVVINEKFKLQIPKGMLKQIPSGVSEATFGFRPEHGSIDKLKIDNLQESVLSIEIKILKEGEMKIIFILN